jgi:oxygen-independent coproporphyrinogen-3 oxidase
VKEKNKGISLYIHFPFCIKKCNYCDFASFPLNEPEKSLYIRALQSEISLFMDHFPDSRIRVETMYFGGGTPSLLSPQELEEILSHLSKYFDFSSISEFTIEANPETVIKNKFIEFRRMGINRVSVGAQSFNENTLKLLGRVHNAAKIYKSFEILRDAGFSNINVDLMFSLPNETLSELMYSLKEAVGLAPEHVSFYSLVLERGTPLFQASKKMNLPNEEESREQYLNGIQFLAENCYSQYEISNFAKTGFECKHNLSYWESRPYLGFGVSAGSFLARRRWKNVSNLESYFSHLNKKELPISFKEFLKGKMQKGEFLIMALRLTEGFDVSLYYNRFGVLPDEAFKDEINFLRSKRFLSADKTRIKLTQKGLLVANRVLEYFI